MEIGARAEDAITPVEPAFTLVQSGPWVLVVGMHRSGTSAVAGLVAALGLADPTPGDLMDSMPDNPHHHESLSLTALNDKVLRNLGGWWFAPPEPPSSWADIGDFAALANEAAAAAAAAFPEPGPRVWKDPRTALVLPFWRLLLPQSPAVFIWRTPMAVAQSLQHRDGLSQAHGLALWHCYNRAALLGLAGSPTYVVGYEDLLGHPMDVALEIARFLDVHLCIPRSGDPDIAAAAGAVSADLEHERRAEALPDEQSRFVLLLRRLRGSHHSFAPGALPDLPLWVRDYLSDRRTQETGASDARAIMVSQQVEITRLAAENGGLAAERDRLAGEVADAAQLARRLAQELESIRHSRSWLVTMPMRRLGAVLRKALR